MEVKNMPGGDGTGPLGLWPRTGRGFGRCFGRGLGLRCWRYAPVSLTKEEQKKILEAELKEIEMEKQKIEKRLKEMK
jgi:hypothetical protein